MVKRIAMLCVVLISGCASLWGCGADREYYTVRKLRDVLITSCFVFDSGWDAYMMEY